MAGNEEEIEEIDEKAIGKDCSHYSEEEGQSIKSRGRTARQGHGSLNRGPKKGMMTPKMNLDAM